jgi:hypothetical protein
MRVARRVLVWNCLLLAGCQTTAAPPSQALALDNNAIARRRLQSRRFETQDERRLLLAAAGVLQDLGFSIDDARADAGLIVASKERDAVEAQQVAAQMLLVIAAAMAKTQYKAVWEKDQQVRVALVVTRATDGQGTNCRATFQRVVTDTNGNVSRVETLEDPALYRSFFESLSKAAFLEANEI